MGQYDSRGNELSSSDVERLYEAVKKLSTNENSGRSLAIPKPNYNRDFGRQNSYQNNQNQRTQRINNFNGNNNNRMDSPKSQVLNCEQTAVCDIIINNPLYEAFKVVIHPMAEIRFLQSIRNGTHVNIDSIQPSTIWLSPQSIRNRVSFLCLPGGIGRGSI